MKAPDIQYRLMTPEEVLRALEAQRDLLDPWDASKAPLTPQMTVWKWRWVYEDYWTPRRLGRNLNELFGLSFGWKQWRQVLSPGRKRTVMEVCEFIAQYAQIPHIQPVCILGTPCATAGKYFAFRHVLASAGAEASLLRPSTILDDRFDDYGSALCRLAPLLEDGQLAPHSAVSGSMVGAIGCLFVVAGSVALTWFGSWTVAAMAVGLGLAFLIFTGVREEKTRKPSDSRLFERYTTVADFCRALSMNAEDGTPSV